MRVEDLGLVFRALGFFSLGGLGYWILGSRGLGVRVQTGDWFIRQVRV